MAALEWKDKVILAHIYGYACAMTVFMYRHPETAVYMAPVIAGLLGTAHWFVMTDDKRPDA
jgi:hypothetical protein